MIISYPETRNNFKVLIDKEWELAQMEAEIIPDTEKELNDVYAPFNQKVITASYGKTSTKNLSMQFLML